MNGARRLGLALLTWRDDAGELHIGELHVDRPCSIGRLATTSFVIRWDPKVSGLHAKLECVAGQWVVSDDGLSRNGTYLNGSRIREYRLHDGDVIRVGQVLLTFHAVVADPRTAPAATTVEDGGQKIPEFDDRDIEVLVELCRDYVVLQVPKAVGTPEIARRLNFTTNMVKNRLRDMYKQCGIADLPDGAKRAELMRLVVGHGIVSVRHYDEAGPGGSA